MRSVKGIYDGAKVELLEKAQDLRPGKVIITFIDEDGDIEALREYSTDEDAFNFWKGGRRFIPGLSKKVDLKHWLIKFNL